MARELGKWIATPVEPVGVFTRAEDYHQKYYLRHSGLVYEEIRVHYPEEREFVDSTSAARLNGYMGGHGNHEQFEVEADLLGLSAEAITIVHDNVEEVEASCGGY